MSTTPINPENVSKSGTFRRGPNRTKSTVSIFQAFDNPDQKTLKTAQQKLYNIPSQKSEDYLKKVKPRETTGEPVFLSGDGVFYDINYVPVFTHKLPEKGSLNNNSSNSNNNQTGSSASADNIESNDTENNQQGEERDDDEEEEEEETLQEQLVHLYNSIPQIDEFENFFDYEQAFLDWKYAVDQIFDRTRLPVITGRAYYRPKLSDFQKMYRGTSTFGDYRPSVSSFSIEGGSGSIGGDGDEKSDPLNSEIEDDTAEHNYNEFSLLKDQLESSSEPWDSLLIPQEPQPIDYNTFEEYDDALMRWASICSQLPVFPPHPSQLKDLIPIQSIAESQMSVNIDIIVEQRSKSQRDADGSNSLANQSVIKSGLHEMVFMDLQLPSSNLTRQQDQQKKLEAELEEKEQKRKQQSQLNDLIARNNSRVSPAISTKPMITVDQDTKQRIQQVIQQLWDKRDKAWRETGERVVGSDRQEQTLISRTYVAPFIAKIHGTHDSSALLSSTQQQSTFTLKNDALRRTDLTSKQIHDNYDCPTRVSGMPVKFLVPHYDVVFEPSKCIPDSTYQQNLIQQLKVFHYGGRHNELYSWYHPMVPPEEHQKHKEEIDFIIMSQQRITKDKLNIQNISDILYGDMYLDKFSDLLDSSFSEDFDGGKSYATVITKSITPDNIQDLLALLEQSKSPLFHAKLSFLVMNFFSGNKGSNILEKLIANRDVKNLSLLTYSFDFITEVPTELIPWSDETNLLVKSLLGDSIEVLWKLIFCYYYLNVIGKVLDIHVHLYYSKSIINQSKVSITHSIATLLQTNTPNILDKIFTGISHRSKSVSSFCLFILLQLMSNQEGLAVHNCLKAENSNLYGRVKKICESKLKHVQFAARRLFSVFGKAPWVDFVYKEYNKDPEQCLSVCDFIGNDEKKPSSLLLEMLLEFFTTSLDRTIEAATASLPISNTTSSSSPSSLSSSMGGMGMGGSGMGSGSMMGSGSSMGSLMNNTPPLSPVGSPPVSMSSSFGGNTPNITIGIKNKFSFVLDGALFHHLLAHIIKNSKVSSYQMYVISALLSKLAKTHFKLGTIQVNQNSVKTSQKKWGHPMLSLSPIDIRNMSSKMNDPVPGQYQYPIKTNMLSTIRSLLKFSMVFDVVKKEDDFYTRLLAFCKDGVSAEFNRQAWCLLYQIMRHHIGTIESLIKDGILSGFLEMMGTSSHPTVICHSLHYITKMFNIAEIETKNPKRTKNDAKIIEKDNKLLNSLFKDKTLFIKVHMIYKKYKPEMSGVSSRESATISTSQSKGKVVDRSETVNKFGLAFIELAKFYYLLNTSPHCAKLLRDTLKKEEYKEGLRDLYEMFLSKEQLISPSNNTPNSGAIGTKPSTGSTTNGGSPVITPSTNTKTPSESRGLFGKLATKYTSFSSK
ncbi:hypothetical protein ACTFIV_001374 [Dictyostelium citrinum]